MTAGGGNISSVTGVAFGKLDVVAKRMLHGGEHLWREAFHPLPEEHLRKCKSGENLLLFKIEHASIKTPATL